jgi:vancomycin permeability regulator SanA
MRGGWVRRLLWLAVIVAVGLSAAIGGARAWLNAGAYRHLFEPSQAPAAPVVIVLGAQVTTDGAPKAILAGRLDTAAALLATGRARVVLVSGDGRGASGNETAVMTDYLLARGVDPARIVADPYGLDTYDSCKRAHQVYGVTRALVVSQSFHLTRAVALCRHVGIDAEGVLAGCATCSRLTWARNHARDLVASIKAVADAGRDRAPAVTSPPSRAIPQALSL